MNKSVSRSLGIVLSYAVAAALWIALSDRLVGNLSSIHNTQTYKGWAFVAGTSVLLYFILLRYLLRLEGRRPDASRRKIVCGRAIVGSGRS
jgi:hypothetical protein